MNPDELKARIISRMTNMLQGKVSLDSFNNLDPIEKLIFDNMGKKKGDKDDVIQD